MKPLGFRLAKSLADNCLSCYHAGNDELSWACLNSGGFSIGPIPGCGCVTRTGVWLQAGCCKLDR